jgi:hypothetical protein
LIIDRIIRDAETVRRRRNSGFGLPEEISGFVYEALLMIDHYEDTFREHRETLTMEALQALKGAFTTNG